MNLWLPYDRFQPPLPADDPARATLRRSNKLPRRFDAASLFFVALLALNACASGDPEAEPSEPTPPGTAEVIPYDVVEGYRFEDRDWKVVVISPGASENDLRALAGDLRAQFPDHFFQIFDDLSQVDDFVAWRVNFPNDAFPKPEEWMNSHHVATVRRILEQGVREWQLRGGQAHPTHSGKKIVALP